MFSDLFYGLYLAVVVGLFAVIPVKGRTFLLAASGVIFYAYYGGYYLLLLLPLTLISWLVLFEPRSSAAADATTTTSWLRTTALCAIVVFVSVLAYFKYGGFLANIFNVGFAHQLAAPLAISFFTFEFIHVAAERYRGNIGHIPFWNYCAFIFFFPTMIAGPIKRYGQFSASLLTAQISAKDIVEGLFRIALGLFKKLVIADNLNTLIAEVGSPEKTHNLVLLCGAVFLYGLRIFFDFAGYSDIAIGSARLFGLKVPENFLHPYFQNNITDFWRHWHISLYTWLIDYVYIPLGGSRVPFPHILLNIFLVMIVSGIWHGAAWNFILWGAWHGMMLVTHRIYNDKVVPTLHPFLVTSVPAKAAAYLITMLGVWIGWMMFMWSIKDLQIITSLLTGQS